ncbi:MAG: phosphate regulon sensor histidine kinase PhoR [Pseudomonadota bacterium]
MRDAWVQEYSLLVLAAGGGALIGAVFEAVLVGLVLGLLIYVLFLHLRLGRLLRNSTGHNWASPPIGVPGAIQGRVRRAWRRWFARQHRLIGLLRRYHDSAMSIPDATVVLNQKLEIEWLNRAATDVFGVGRRDRGLRIDGFLRSPSFGEWLRQDPFDHVLEIASPVDESRQLSLRLQPYGDDRMLLVGRDITALQRLQAVRQDFVANVSHELRTPLTVLAGYVETLNDMADEFDPQMRRILLNMQQQGERMRRIVEDLLLLSRLETTVPQESQFEDVPVADLLEGIAHDADLLSGEDRHVIAREIDPTLRMRGITRELQSAFSNLVFNAVKYTPAGGHITLRWRLAPEGRVFEVVDTGLGIDRQHIPRLTERFYRVDVGRSRSRGGTGLGLAIVKHVLLRHGGRLEIESELGRGSCFRCVFPEKLESSTLSYKFNNAVMNEP